MSSDATSFASHSGSRWATSVMPVPSLMVLVAPAIAASATNWSWVRQYSSGSGGAPSRPPHGVRRLTGMCECSGNQRLSKPRASASLPSSTGWMPLSVGKMSSPMRMRTRLRRSITAALASGVVVPLPGRNAPVEDRSEFPSEKEVRHG